jgi:hypothetical protein
VRTVRPIDVRGRDGLETSIGEPPANGHDGSGVRANTACGRLGR